MKDPKSKPNPIDIGKTGKCENCWETLDVPAVFIPKAFIQVHGVWLCLSCYNAMLRGELDFIKYDDRWHLVKPRSL